MSDLACSCPWTADKTVTNDRLGLPKMRNQCLICRKGELHGEVELHVEHLTRCRAAVPQRGDLSAVCGPRPAEVKGRTSPVRHGMSWREIADALIETRSPNEDSNTGSDSPS